jgi:hypothetical protein
MMVSLMYKRVLSDELAVAGIKGALGLMLVH